MNAQALVADFSRRNIRLIPDGDGLIVEPASRLTDADREAIRQHKAGLLAYLCTSRGAEAPAPERNRWPGRIGAPPPLRRCGALICSICHVISPSPHHDDCIAPRFDACRSRWFWLSPHGAIKCCVCDPPADLSLAEGWVLAREPDGSIPGEIMSLLHVTSPLQ